MRTGRGHQCSHTQVRIASCSAFRQPTLSLALVGLRVESVIARIREHAVRGCQKVRSCTICVYNTESRRTLQYIAHNCNRNDFDRIAMTGVDTARSSTGLAQVQALSIEQQHLSTVANEDLTWISTDNHCLVQLYYCIVEANKLWTLVLVCCSRCP